MMTIITPDITGTTFMTGTRTRISERFGPTRSSATASAPASDRQRESGDDKNGGGDFHVDFPFL
jgi:hypothetical protein